MERRFITGDIVVEEEQYWLYSETHEVGIISDNPEFIHWFWSNHPEEGVGTLDITKLHCPKDKLF